MTVLRCRHLLDLFPRARINAPAPEYAGGHRMYIGDDCRDALFLHPPATVDFPPMVVGAHATLRFGVGVKEAAWSHMTAPVGFRVLARSRWRDTEVFARWLDPAHEPTDRRWLDAAVDLNRWVGREVTLRLETSVPRGASTAYCWSGWSDPCVADEVPPDSRGPRPSGSGHVVLVTADALRADALGCYGTIPSVTPNLDRLAREGVRFAHARTQAAATQAAYVSLLTGLTPFEHGVTAEWGRFPAGLPTLPGAFREHGWHTLFAPSEAELAEEAFGFPALFADTLPCVVRPAQDGAATLRRFEEWLGRRPRGPFFVWLQFFDAHPPCIPPARHRGLLAGAPVPVSPPELHAVESLAALDFALPLLERGVADAELGFRLAATARALSGAPGTGPDLATHLRAVDSETRGGRSLRDFALWLGGQAERLVAGEVSDELLVWLRALRPHLARVEAEHVAWLRGAADATLPIAMYRGAVAYVDELVGRLREILAAHGLDNDTTLAVVAPHGEALGERGVWFHHHTLLECCLRVPAILRPGKTVRERRPEYSPGRVVDGVFDLVDLMPTLLDCAGLVPPGGLVGRSRWADVVSGAPIELHDSFAVAMSGVLSAIMRDGMKALQARGAHRMSDAWTWRAGEHAILALDRRGEGEIAPDSLAGCGAELVARLRQRCGGSVLDPPTSMSVTEVRDAP